MHLEKSSNSCNSTWYLRNSVKNESIGVLWTDHRLRRGLHLWVFHWVFRRMTIFLGWLCSMFRWMRPIDDQLQFQSSGSFNNLNVGISNSNKNFGNAVAYQYPRTRSFRFLVCFVHWISIIKQVLFLTGEEDGEHCRWFKADWGPCLNGVKTRVRKLRKNRDIHKPCPSQKRDTKSCGAKPLATGQSSCMRVCIKI